MTKSGSCSSEWQSSDSNVDLSSFKAKVLSSAEHTEVMLIVPSTEGMYLVNMFILKLCLLTVRIIIRFSRLLKGGLVV